MTGIVYDGGKLGMDAMLFGMSNFHNPNDSIVINDFTNNKVLTNTSDYFNSSLINLNQIYQSDEVVNLAKTLIMRQGSALNQNVMTFIDRSNIVNANSMMQYIINSNPEIIRLDNLGIIDGYPSISRDADLINYINDGVVNIVNDEMSYISFESSAYDDFTDLDKDAVIKCWETVNELLAEGLDPTSEDLLPF
jgi:hypothetical protein